MSDYRDEYQNSFPTDPSWAKKLLREMEDRLGIEFIDDIDVWGRHCRPVAPAGIEAAAAEWKGAPPRNVGQFLAVAQERARDIISQQQ